VATLRRRRVGARGRPPPPYQFLCMCVCRRVIASPIFKVCLFRSRCGPDTEKKDTVIARDNVSEPSELEYGKHVESAAGDCDTSGLYPVLAVVAGEYIKWADFISVLIDIKRNRLHVCNAMSELRTAAENQRTPWRMRQA
jgi:hypothetical protein